MKVVLSQQFMPLRKPNAHKEASDDHVKCLSNSLLMDLSRKLAYNMTRLGKECLKTNLKKNDLGKTFLLAQKPAS